jgi:hypothetical protein
MAELNVWESIGPTNIVGVGGLEAVGRCTSLAVHPANSKTIFVGARGSGVWRTTNGGLTWAPVADLLPTLTVAAIAIDPK